MSTLANLLVQLGLDTKQIDEGIQGVKTKFEGMSGKLKATGAVLSGALTAPILGLGAVALGAASQYDSALDTIQLKT
jgi:hypothetical protein